MYELLGYSESKTAKVKRMEIINSTRDIFIRDGIHPVTMKNIAKGVDISIRSLYYYYKNKDDLTIDIQIIELHKILSGISTVSLDGSTGYENIVSFFNNFYFHLISQKKAVKYITAFDYYFYNGYPTDKYIKFLNDFVSMKEIYNLFSMGSADGSMNFHGLNSKLVCDTVFSGFFALAQKNIYREKSFIEAKRERNNGDLQVFIKLFLEALRKRGN